VTAPSLGGGDRVLVTGASGFIGSAVVRALLGTGASVRAGVEPGADPANLEGLDVEPVTFDVCDAAGVARAVEGCRAVFHVAARYGFWPTDPGLYYEVNVGGTRNVLEAVAESGCERLVYTSSVATLGLHDTAEGRPADETAYAHVHELFGAYKQSKYVAEHEVLRAGAEGLPVVLALPTFPLGPRDRRPTPTGKLVLDFLNGKMPGYVDTSMNVVHVDDVARGHVLALERGGQGRSYILGGENLPMGRLLALLASCTGLPTPRFQFPRVAALGAGLVSETVQGRLLRREPDVPVEAARMSTTHMLFDDARARKELGHDPRPAEEAVFDSARWFAEHGYVKPSRLARLRWASAPSPEDRDP